MKLAPAILLCACSAPAAPGWMAGVPDDTSLTALTLPGTHDTMALYELIADTAKTQTLTLAAQYDAGVRFVDIRGADENDILQIVHGDMAESATFDDVQAATDAFLDAHPSETIVMSVKQDADTYDSTTTFEQAFRAYVTAEPDRWYTGDAVPALGDVRGKIVLLRRFTAAQTPLGIDGSQWADNTTFTIDNADSTLAIEDNYIVSDPQQKWSQITAQFELSRAGDPSTLYIAFASGYVPVNGLSSISMVSNVINPLLDSYFADPANAGAHLGIIPMDFVTPERVQALVALAAPAAP